MRRRELPGDRVVAIVNLGAPIRVRAPDSEWATHRHGVLRRPPRHVRDHGDQRRAARVQIDLTPVSAHLLLRLPMHIVTHRVVGLEDLLDRAGLQLHEQLATATHLAQRFAALDAFFLTRLDDALAGAEHRRALARLKATQNAVSVSTLTRELGAAAPTSTVASRSTSASRRSCSPASCASTTRSSWPPARAAGPRSPSAPASYDQAHMIRDFHQFAGAAPTEFARRRLPDGGGVRAD